MADTVYTEKTDLTGMVFNIQRHSIEDGPGIRTTIFLKGCPMRCPWCHNPEGIESQPQLVWYQFRCIGARGCLGACPKNALTLTADGMLINRELCDICGLCVDACPAAAFELVGKRMTAQDVAQAALRDRPFYEASGGGVTISGGEPALQAVFSRTIMELLQNEGVHIALDTCGGMSWRVLQPLVSLSNLVLYDLKTMDEDEHYRYTGMPLRSVLDNARKIARTGKPMWVRTPIIPGYTDDEEKIRNIARFILQDLPTVERYDLLAFNNTCINKYRRLDSEFPLVEEDLVSEERMKALVKVASEVGLDFVHWSGMTSRKTE